MEYTSAMDIVEAVMNDIPKVDYVAEIAKAVREDAIAHLPPGLLKFLKNNPDGEVYLTPNMLKIGSAYIAVPNKAYDYHRHATERVKERVDVLLSLHQEQLIKRADAYRNLIRLLNSGEPVPELDRYIKGRRLVPSGERISPAPVNKGQILNGLRTMGWVHG